MASSWMETIDFSKHSVQPGTKILTDFSSLGRDGYVSAEDVSFLRMNVFQDGVIDRDELARIFALGEIAPNGDREWAMFFAEAVGDFFLNEEEPRGYLTETEFDHLKRLVTRDGARASSLELGVLVRVMESAVSTPADMGGFVCDQIRRVIAEKPGGPSVSADDAALISRALYAAGGDGAVGISRNEAELLYDLHDMTVEADNDPAWIGLFMRAIAAYLMMHVGYAPIARKEAIRLHEWASDHSVNPTNFLSRGIRDFSFDVFTKMGKKNDWLADHNAKVDGGITDAEKITAYEADWLSERIGRNGVFDEAEKALLQHLKSLDAQLPPNLAALVAQA